ncbi:MAG: PAS domain S-box protein [Verrucomicrobia bacterium]|nr:PAS domain S-box protein [Verrucomicrobiota bacterium]
MSEPDGTLVQEGFRDADVSKAVEQFLAGRCSLLGLAGDEIRLSARTQPELGESEEVLRQAADQQRAIFDALPARIAVLDSEGIILAVNDAWRRFAQENPFADPQADVGQNYLNICDRVQGDEAGPARMVADGIRAVLSGQTPDFTLEHTCHSPGEERWFRLVVRPLTIGRIRGAVLVHVDITSPQAMQERIRRSEQVLRTVIEASEDVIWERDLVTGVITWPDRQVEEMLGYPPSQLRSFEELFTLVHPDDRDRMQQGLSAHLATQVPYRVELRMQRKDGSYGHFISVAKALRDAHGTPVRLVGSLRDVTMQRQAEARVSEQAALLDKAQDAIHVKDLEGRLVYWNRSSERVHGWKADEVLGRSAADFLYVDGAQFAEARRALLQKGEWTGETAKWTKDGRRLTVRTSWTLVHDAQGQPKAILSINTDVTDRKRLEAQFFRAQRLESLGTLAGGIAHDLNNVLAPMLLAIEALQAKVSDPEDREFLELLEHSAQRGAAMVRQVLSFARGVEGRRIPIQPRELLHELDKILSTTFLKQIQIHLRVGRDTWSVVGDSTQLQQAMLNLCVNARDAMPTGGLLTLSAENVVVDEAHAAMHLDARPGPYVLFRVIDTGTGITPEIREKIFEPFFTTKEIGKGTGLGLSTTAAIVKSHGGFINVYSEIGKGTTFSVYFPVEHEQAAESDPVSELIDLSTANGELVLVVDDEVAIRESTRRVLQGAGYRVLLAGDGSEALALYVQHQSEIAVVVTDLMMPILDGIATMRALRRLNPQVRIIAVTGLATKTQTAAASEAGANDFLAKPYTARPLLLMLQRMLHA